MHAQLFLQFKNFRHLILKMLMEKVLLEYLQIKTKNKI